MALLLKRLLIAVPCLVAKHWERRLAFSISAGRRNLRYGPHWSGNFPILRDRVGIVAHSAALQPREGNQQLNCEAGIQIAERLGTISC